MKTPNSILWLTVLKILVHLTQGQKCAFEYPWTYKGSKICFVVTNFVGSWSAANNHCKSLHSSMRLPVVKDIETAQLITHALIASGKGQYKIWLAAFRSGSPYKWVDGTPLFTNDTKWHAGEPSNNLYCVLMWPKTKTVNGETFRTFDDEQCGRSALAVCSTKIVASSVSSSVEVMFAKSPSLGPYKNEYTQNTAAGANPVLELEKVGLKAARDLLNSNQTDITETVQTDVMKMQIRKFTVSVFQGQVFTSIGNKASLNLPQSALSVANTSSDFAATIGIAYSSIEDANNMNKKVTLGNSSTTWMLDSDVMTFSVLYEDLNFTQPVVMSFQSKREEQQREENDCVFWNVTLNTWSKEGCFKVASNINETTCHCYHLTTFASLMQVIPDEKKPISQSELFTINVITYVCFALSYVGIFITISSFLLSRTLTRPNNFVHFNLCLAILFAQTAFLSAIKSTQNKAVCKFVAVLLHYLYLAVGCWMFVEGFFILRMTKRVFNTSRNLLLYCCIGWGIPAFIVGCIFAALNEHYGYEEACWLTRESGVIWAFAGPMILIVTFNVIVLVVAVKATLNIRMNRSKSDREKIGVGIKAVAILLPLLGLTWVFGLLAIGTAATAMQVLFAISNGLQGFFIFIFHCARNPEFKNRSFFTRNTVSSGSGKNRVAASRSTTRAASDKKGISS
ncbi:adhesion G-protein coupled receptor D1-like [Rhopilema esculentum]|uniref:adhesion G-protein coupled receptor D1-like n=1 Tax=Rhopilema esculentum TaxID=499914 RepID=UPI0031E06382